MFAAIDAQLGRLTALVNNAGVVDVTARLDEMSVARLKRMFDINVIGAMLCAREAVRRMSTRHGGRGGAIVNVSSRGAFRGEPDCPAYGASKAGMNAFGQSMALALASHGIWVGTVAPGFVETEMAREVLDGPGGDAVRAQ
jgi:NAD(P)-dependent dehydrogenase (short-subunit alcohol dehydrogenase family)